MDHYSLGLVLQLLHTLTMADVAQKLFLQDGKQ